MGRAHCIQYFIIVSSTYVVLELNIVFRESSGTSNFHFTEFPSLQSKTQIYCKWDKSLNFFVLTH